LVELTRRFISSRNWETSMNTTPVSILIAASLSAPSEDEVAGAGPQGTFRPRHLGGAIDQVKLLPESPSRAFRFRRRRLQNLSTSGTWPGGA
jgi:hypothetical protein